MAAEAARKKRRMTVFEMKACFNASFEQIGQQLGISGRQAKKDYAKACLEYGQETAADHKAKANGRFDRQVGQIERTIASLQLLAEGIRNPADPSAFITLPDFEANARIASLQRTLALIAATQAKMNGAFAPVVVEHTGNVDLSAQASPAKAKALLRDYFGGNAGVPDSQLPGEADPPGPEEGPTAH